MDSFNIQCNIHITDSYNYQVSSITQFQKSPNLLLNNNINKNVSGNLDNNLNFKLYNWSIHYSMKSNS